MCQHTYPANHVCPQDGRDLIHAAAHSGNLELVQWLVDRHTAEPSQLVVRSAYIMNHTNHSTVLSMLKLIHYISSK